ncbi:LacI family DNA-binding transcriptional regulator [Enterococcus sp. JM9B]|uniref:LacI family DNA-binding transcriptional regulator n=1 Tax=Enterococcus sp. JM9B TaxID=1857216 RepID=UPI001374BFF8|nr:LacI family DNA-binding transcriptional regulator [Enterococcus sp. JM9B]KAF1303117.1 hypothetical protein BAU16_05425 [Enterococcus sp. JM9B]
MVGIRDVAHLAGVSPATVSRVINEDKSLSVTAETKKRIYAAIEELNYVKKGTKKSSRNSSIGIITAVSIRDEFEDPYFRSIRLGIALEARKQHIAANRIYRLHKDIKIEDLSELGAVVILGQLDKSILDIFYMQNKNLIIIDDPYCDEIYDAVYVDLKKAMEKHLERLFDLGHKKIAFIGGLRKIPIANQEPLISEEEIRLETYRSWMKARGLYDGSYELLAGWTTDSGYLLMEELLNKMDRKDYPTAVIVVNDPMAIGVFRAVQKREIRIPEDITVCSFDDIEIASFMTPTLTTAHIDTEDLGRYAIRLAKERIDQERERPVHVILPTELIVRES